MKIYVASSWRNEFQPLVVSELREDGHSVYDFRHPEEGNDGFSWRAIGDGWQAWTVPEYLAALRHPIAAHGFDLDMQALKAADICIMVMPCGMSASLETGYAVGAGKPTAVYVPAMREPDLMVKMTDFVTDDLVALCQWARDQRHKWHTAMSYADLRADGGLPEARALAQAADAVDPQATSPGTPSPRVKGSD